MSLDDALTLAERALVCILIEETDGRISVGSGVLARFGGRDVVLTVGHNVREGRSGHAVVIQFPTPAALFRRDQPRDHIETILSSKEPDVAVIVLRADQAARWAHMAPVLPDELGPAPAELHPAQGLVLLGYPSELSAHGKVATGGEREANFIAQPGVSIPCRELIREGNALHVDYGKYPYYRDGVPVALPYPGGISGGPLFVLHQRGRTLIGLARSICTTTKMERCEPIAHAVALLATHEDPGVRAAADATSERLGATV